MSMFKYNTLPIFFLKYNYHILWPAKGYTKKMGDRITKYNIIMLLSSDCYVRWNLLILTLTFWYISLDVNKSK